MTMKRRGFLGMLGAAIAAPALPSAASGVTPQIRALAAAHARKYPFISVIGISKRIGVSMRDAEEVLVELSRKGMVGPVNSCATGPISASSRVFRPVMPATTPFKAKRSVDRASHAPARPEATPQMHVDLSALLRHLRTLCGQQGVAA